MATCAVILGPFSLVVVALATPPVPCALCHPFTHRVRVELPCGSVGVASSVGSSKWIPWTVSVPIGPVVIVVAAAVPVVVVVVVVVVAVHNRHHVHVAILQSVVSSMLRLLVVAAEQHEDHQIL